MYERGGGCARLRSPQYFPDVATGLIFILFYFIFVYEYEYSFIYMCVCVYVYMNMNIALCVCVCVCILMYERGGGCARLLSPVLS